MRPYVVVYKTRAGYVNAWSDHDTREEAEQTAVERADKTQRPHWVAMLVVTATPSAPSLGVYR